MMIDLGLRKMYAEQAYNYARACVCVIDILFDSEGLIGMLEKLNKILKHLFSLIFKHLHAPLFPWNDSFFFFQ